jgi:hypothetical protein
MSKRREILKKSSIIFGEKLGNVSDNDGRKID